MVALFPSFWLVEGRGGGGDIPLFVDRIMLIFSRIAIAIQICAHHLLIFLFIKGKNIRQQGKGKN
jgi:hypothetical protein